MPHMNLQCAFYRYRTVRVYENFITFAYNSHKQTNIENNETYKTEHGGCIRTAFAFLR